MTSYYILKALINDQEFTDYMKSGPESDSTSAKYDQIVTIINELQSYEDDKNKLLEKLKADFDASKVNHMLGWSFRNSITGAYSFTKVLNGILNDLYYPGRMNTPTLTLE
jgi:hypothetical protein